MQTTTNNIKTLEPGSYSHGTLRAEDLIPCFLHTLWEVNPDAAQAIKERYSVEIRLLERYNKTGLPMTEESWDNINLGLHEVLFDKLNEHVPSGYYFGSHPGDGSDFGVWECETWMDND